MKKRLSDSQDATKRALGEQQRVLYDISKKTDKNPKIADDLFAQVHRMNNAFKPKGV